MKLSEAIRLGAMMGPQVFGHLFGDEKDSSCALGAVTLATGKRLGELEEGAFAQIVADCPDCEVRGTLALALIAHLNDDHRWTRERIAEWVATIEPAEVHASETNGECSLGKGPIGPTPEVETAETKTILI